MHSYGHYAEGTGSVLKMANIDVSCLLGNICHRIPFTSVLASRKIESISSHFVSTVIKIAPHESSTKINDFAPYGSKRIKRNSRH